MDSSLLLLPLHQRLALQALALGIPPQALAENLVPVLACNSLLSFAAAAVNSPAVTEDASSGASADWTAKEDDLLMSLIAEHGTSKWSRIAAKMGTKSNRQCRRRWQAILNAMGNKGSWTAEEDAKLIEGHRRFGNRWTDIARLVPGRTDNAVKNRFASLVAKGDGAGSPKIQRWSDVCVVPKAVESVSGLEKGFDAAVEGSCPSPASPSAGSSCSSNKRKGGFGAESVEAAAPSLKRLKPAFALDLNVAPVTEGCLAWLDSDSEPECSESSYSQFEAVDDSIFDLNSPASA